MNNYNVNKDKSHATVELWNTMINLYVIMPLRSSLRGKNLLLYTIYC